MGTKLIRLEDGILVEVEASGNEVQAVAGFADSVDATFSKIKPVLLKACRPVVSALRDMSNEIDIEQAEIEVGFSFEGEGNVYVAKAKLGANVIVRMTLKSK